MKGIIIGGGIIGLSLARELYKKGIEITIIEKERIGRGASWVAGGMLAPQSEGLEIGDMLDLCLESRNMYKDYIIGIEKDTGLQTGYWDSGIFCPAFSEEEKEKLLNKLENYKKIGLTGDWLDRKEVEDKYPSLGEEIIGGVLYPDDGQVDNRLLMIALENYVRNSDIEILEYHPVKKIIEKNGKFEYVETEDRVIEGDFCILSAGAWSGLIYDIPVFPIKGEMAAVDVEKKDIDKVFFSSRAYLIPRKDYTRLVIGATEEKTGFKKGNTVKGVMQLFKGLVDTFPHFKEKNIQELWFGYRPATPDLEPILGESDIKNLYFATGHHRNGILLAPITSKLLVDLIVDNRKGKYLDIFNEKRF
jgi:glycine oxidase ThiO